MVFSPELDLGDFSQEPIVCPSFSSTQCLVLLPSLKKIFDEVMSHPEGVFRSLSYGPETKFKKNLSPKQIHF